MIQDYEQVKSSSGAVWLIVIVFSALLAGIVTFGYFYSAEQLVTLRDKIAATRVVLSQTPVPLPSATVDPKFSEIQKKRELYSAANTAIKTQWDAGNYKEASASSLVMYQNAVTTADWVTAYGWSGSVLNKQKKYKEAEVVFKKALELNPQYMTSYAGLDELYYARKEYKNMLANAEQALIVQESSFYYNEKGVALDSLGRTAEAVVAYRKAIELDPKNDVAVDNLRRSLQDL
jgi:tetratricopeptide (TPR) repeat protein